MTPLSGTSSSSLVVLPTQIFCWHNDQGGGLPQFSANDDLLVQGQIGSLEEFFCHGVSVGTGTTVYGDGLL